MKRLIIILALVIFSCSKSDDSDSSSFLEKYNDTYWQYQDSPTTFNTIKFSTTNIFTFDERNIADTEGTDNYCYYNSEGSQIDNNGNTLTTTIIENKGKRYSFEFDSEYAGTVTVWQFVVSDDDQSMTVTVNCNGSPALPTRVYNRSQSISIFGCRAHVYLGGC